MEDGRYKGLLDDIDSLESFEAIARLTTPSLLDFQSKDLLHILAVKKFCCMYDTGMGKTFIASGFMKALRNYNKGVGKFLIFATNSQLDETADTIGKISGLKCVIITESAKTLLSDKDLDNNDVIIMAHGCLNVKEHMLKLCFILDQFSALIIDEMHLVSNFVNSKNALMLTSICGRFEYLLGLTATPITTDVEQLARVLHMINPSAVGNWRSVTSDLKNFGSSMLEDNLRDLFVVRQRKLNNHVGLSLSIDAMPHQVGAIGQDLFEITKGYGATAQHSYVKQIIELQRPQRGLIYSNRHNVQKALFEYLISNGIKCIILNGETTREQRNIIVKDFRDNKYDVIITNITTSIDLTADYVLFYEFTPHVKQFIGRAERGIVSKQLSVIFLFTKDTDEYDYFYRNVYQISQSVQDILEIDLKEITKLRNSEIFE